MVNKDVISLGDGSIDGYKELIFFIIISNNCVPKYNNDYFREKKSAVHRKMRLAFVDLETAYDSIT